MGNILWNTQSYTKIEKDIKSILLEKREEVEILKQHPRFQYLTIDSSNAFTHLSFFMSDRAIELNLPQLTIEYSWDGEDWYDLTADDDSLEIDNEIVYLRGYNKSYGFYDEENESYCSYCYFYADNPCLVYGNIMSLVDGDNFYKLETLEEPATFINLFGDDTQWLESVYESNIKKLVLPAKILSPYCYKELFHGAPFSRIPDLPATTLAEGCYYGMFSGMQYLSKVDFTLPAKKLTPYCYYTMFDGCTITELTLDFQGTETAPYCCYRMFNDCDNMQLMNMTLPAKVLTEHCYQDMFKNCNDLENAPEILATTLAPYCCDSMFKGCGLAYGPKLLAKKIETCSYDQMFEFCESLCGVTCLATEGLEELESSEWLEYVGEEGVLIVDPEANWPSSLIPDGWTIRNYDPMLFIPLTFEAVEDDTDLSFISSQTWRGLINIWASADNGKTWRQYRSSKEGTKIKSLSKGEKVLIKAYVTATSLDLSTYSTFNTNKRCLVYGNILSLMSESPQYNNQKLHDYAFVYLFRNSNIIMQENKRLILPSMHLGACCYYGLFSDCLNLQIAPELPAIELENSCYGIMFENCPSLLKAPILPATTLANNCYYNMFGDCESLTTAPVLPATTLVSYCYQNMFWGCTSLITPPELPATTLADGCYYNMFYNCTSLLMTPELPATTLAYYCYRYMFKGCTSLTTAPILPATTLATYCYYGMFEGCISLTTAPELSATTLATYCYYNMFRNCTSLTVVQSILPATTLKSSCYQSMFEGCTSLITAPELPATTLANYCYYRMFYGCTSLATAPDLNANKFANYCYQEMFYNCVNISSIVCLATDVSSSRYPASWVHNVSSSGTFTKAANANWPSGSGGIPVGWTVIER